MKACQWPGRCIKGCQMPFTSGSRVDYNGGFLQIVEKYFNFAVFLVISRLVWEDVSGT